jgi:sugar phosphate isomerase/epimerase
MRMKNLKYLLTGYLLFLSICTSSFYAQEVGIIMGTARQMMQNPEEGLIKLKEMGIKYIEGAGARGMSRVEYKKLLDKHGFDVVASGVTFEKIEIPDSIKPIIENLKFYGAEYAVCYWIPHKGDDFTFADMERGVKVFNEAGKIFAEAGISLLYHPHGYEFRPYDGPGYMFDYMMEKTDPRYINYEMDVFWIRNPGQNPAAIMRKYPNRFKLTHLKDRMIGSIDNQNGRQDKERNVVLGTGDVNIAEVMKAAKEIGIKYHLIEDESSRAAVQLPQHLQYLRQLNLDVQTLELSMKSLVNAMIVGDSTALRNLTSEELTYGHSNGQVDTKAQFVNTIVSGKNDFIKLEAKDQDITVKGDVAYVRNNLSGELLNNGTPATLNLKVLFVWIKEGGMWKLFARQAVKV